MVRVRKIVNLSTMLFIAFLALPGRVHAAASSANCTESVLGFLGFPTWYKYLSPRIVGGECVLNPDASGVSDFNILADLPKILMAVFEIILRVGGMVAVGFIIFSGFQFILSQGNPEQTKAARNSIINALIGLAISISSVTVVNLIGNNL